MSRPMQHWVCFDCRKQFRRPLRLASDDPWRRFAPAEHAACPECKQPMVDMGKYFRPPRREERRTWEQLRRMAAHGFRFCRESFPGWIGHALQNTSGKLAADVVIAECTCHSYPAGKALLRKIAARRTRR